jgi:hypothetical protein
MNNMKELEDYDWFPPVLRRFQTEFIGQLVAWTQIYQPLVQHLEQYLQKHPDSTIIDLCTGDGTPILYVTKRLNGAVPVVLTDKFPHLQPQDVPASVQVCTTPFDVLDTTFEPHRIYTMFNAFHHFSQQEQLLILKRLQASGSPFMLVEILQPTLFEALKIAITTTIGQLLLAPFVRPFSGLRLLLTYIFPINLVTVTTDGLISVSKSKSPKMYQHLTAVAQQPHYALEVLSIPTHFFTRLTVIAGIPQHVVAP